MRLIYGVLVFLFSCSVFAKIPEEIKNFAKDDLWREVKISPQGNYLSAVTRIDGRRVITLIDAKTLKPMHTIKFRGYYQPGDYHWASDRRIVTEKQYFKGYVAHPVSYGEYFAVNADGSRAKNVFGFENQTGWNNNYQWGEMLDPLPNDSRFALIVGTKMSKTKAHKPTVYRVNITRGTSSKLVQAPLKHARFLTDSDNQVRFATGYDDNNVHKTLIYRDDKWLGTADLKIANESFVPVSIKGNSHQVYALYSDNGGPAGLYLFDLDSGKKQTIYQHDKVTISGVKKDQSGHVYAVMYDDGYPKTAIVDGDHPKAKLLKNLMTTLEGFNVEFISQTLDGKKQVVLAYNQFNPGEYLLYDTDTEQLRYLLSRRPWADPQTTAFMLPFNFKNRDNQSIDAYITLPAGVDTLAQAKSLPFVVKVHGGPHGIRDWMGYDGENQLYASNGIGVLQVNFRGSGGYGEKFLTSGYRRWGDAVQHDIIDGIKALIAQGVADKNRLCIVGASFGGYSALQSSILEPDLFKCAIGTMGVYDLALLHKLGDVQQRDIGRSFLEKYVGHDKKALKKGSPVHNLDKLKAAVMIVHGAKDERAPIEHAQALKAGLEKHNRDYQWLEVDKEGHGFYKPEHREKVLQSSLAFLQKHLKTKH